MSNTTINLPAYLTRIQLPSQPLPLPTLSTLCTICQQHNRHIPFENIDVVLQRHIHIDLPTIEEKLINNHRGGYCFEQNSLLQAVLLQLGFQSVRRCLCRVCSSMPETPYTHVALVITTSVDDGNDGNDGNDVLQQQWLVDVAFGGKQSVHPILLGSDEQEQQLSDGIFRTRNVGNGYTLVEKKALHRPADNTDNTSIDVKTWHSLYKLRVEETALDVDCQMGNFWTCKFPTSRFCTQFFISRRVPSSAATNNQGKKLQLDQVKVQLQDEFHYILNNSYVARSYDNDGISTDQEITITSKEQLIELVTNVFHIRLNNETDFLGLDRYLPEAM